MVDPSRKKARRGKRNLEENLFVVAFMITKMSVIPVTA